jgi:hypothetical protein
MTITESYEHGSRNNSPNSVTAKITQKIEIFKYIFFQRINKAITFLHN